MRIMSVSFIISLLTFIPVRLPPSVFSPTLESRSCKIIPSDDAWPDESAWDTFNTSLDGRLTKIVPDASPCHDPQFDETICEVVRENWFAPQFQYVIVIL